MRLVADDDRVGARDLAGVAHEPLVGLDGDGAVDGVLALEQRTADALGVAAVAKLAVELVDEVAPVREDQHATGLGGLDEAEGGDGLARPGGVLEPEALRCVGVLGLLAEDLFVLLHPIPRLLLGLALLLDLLFELLLLLLVGLLLVGLLLVLVELVVVLLLGRRARDRFQVVVVLVEVVEVVLLGLVLLLVGDPLRLAVSDRQLAVLRVGLVRPEDVRRGEQLRRGRAAVAVAVRDRSLRLCEQGGERAGQRVDLVRGEDRAVDQLGLLLGEQPLEPEQQREFAPPRRRGMLGLWVLGQLGERPVQRPAPSAPRRQRDGGILAVVQEALAHELLSPRDFSGSWDGRGHEGH